MLAKLSNHGLEKEHCLHLKALKFIRTMKFVKRIRHGFRLPLERTFILFVCLYLQAQFQRVSVQLILKDRVVLFAREYSRYFLQPIRRVFS